MDQVSKKLPIFVEYNGEVSFIKSGQDFKKFIRKVEYRFFRNKALLL